MIPGRYRERPRARTVEAVKLTERNAAAVAEWIGKPLMHYGRDDETPFIPLRHGDNATVGDYVIRDGRSIYSFGGDFFESGYEEL